MKSTYKTTIWKCLKTGSYLIFDRWKDTDSALVERTANPAFATESKELPEVIKRGGEYSMIEIEKTVEVRVIDLMEDLL